MVGEIMYYIEYKNDLFLIITVKINTKSMTLIKRKISRVWCDKYKHLIVDVKNTLLPIPSDYTGLIKYTKKKNISVVFI